MDDLALIRAFIVKELKSFPAGNQPSLFPDIEMLSVALLDFIQLDTKERLIAGLEQKLLSALGEFARPTVNIKQLQGALEALSTGFESFLKKIALVKFADEPAHILYGDSDYKGLLGTTLGNLLTGKIDHKRKNGPAPTLVRPIITYSYPPVDFRQQVYHKAKDLRNDIHVTPDRSFSESIVLFQEIVAAYLLSVQENLHAINSATDPAFAYLKMITNEFRNVQRKVIELRSEERSVMRSDLPVIQAMEWKDNDDDIYEPDSLEDEIKNDEIFKKPLASSSVLELPDSHDKLWVIGEPGAGKSFSLKAIALKYAQQILSTGASNTLYPIYIVANQFSSYKSFKSLIQRNTSLKGKDFDTLIATRKLLLIIDGFNEIAKSERNNAIREIQDLSGDLNNASVLISSRKFGFKEIFDYPVFELLPLTDSMIAEYVGKYVSTADKAAEVLIMLSQSDTLIRDFARNPLMLQMLVKVIVVEGKSPENRGMLFYYFTHWFHSRENKAPILDYVLTETILANIAFKMRSSGKVSMMKNDVLDQLKEILLPLNFSGDIIMAYEQLIDTFLEIDTTYKVVFFHELMLEYFAAVRLNEVFKAGTSIDRNYCNNVAWSEPIIMLTGIVEDASDIVKSVSRHNLILAARCIASGCIVSEEVVRILILKATLFINEKKKGKANAITCLLELGTPEAMRIITKLPPKGESALEDGINNCQRPEAVVLKLFKFGLTGKSRVRKCLSVFYNKQISQAVLDSDEVAQAQKILFENSRLVDYKDLELVENIGISKNALPEVQSAIMDIVSKANVVSSLWRKAIQIAGDRKFIIDNYTVIMDRLNNDLNADGRMGYSLFVAANQMPDNASRKEFVLKATRLCFKRKYYGLAIKFIEHFVLSYEITENEVTEFFAEMVNRGKIRAIISLQNIYHSPAFADHLQAALKNIIKTGSLSHIYENVDVLTPVKAELSNIAVTVREFIESVNKTSLGKEKVKKVVDLLSLTTLLKNIAHVKFINIEKNFGFIEDINTGEAYFFRPEQYVGLKENKLVRYQIKKRSRDPLRRSEATLTDYASVLKL